MTPKEQNLPELPKLAELLPALAAMEKEQIQVYHEAIPADGKPANAEDHLVVAALRRSLDNIRGFVAMAEQRNIFCGMPIVRFQVDTAMVLFARSLVVDVTGFVEHLLLGKKREDYQDKNGKLSDRQLHRKLTKKYPLTIDLYKETSGYVHFSTQHLYRVLDLERFRERGEAIFKSPAERTAGWNDRERRSAFVCFLWATRAILLECKEWLASRWSS